MLRGLTYINPHSRHFTALNPFSFTQKFDSFDLQKGQETDSKEIFMCFIGTPIHNLYQILYQCVERDFLFQKLAFCYYRAQCVEFSPLFVEAQQADFQATRRYACSALLML